MDDRKRVRLEQQITRGWVVEVVDHNQRPPSVVPGSRRFVETSQVAGLFESAFSQNSGVLENPIGLCAYAISASKGTYMYLDPAGIKPIELPGGEVVLSWVPASVWTVRSDHSRNDKWQDSVRVGAVIPDDMGNIMAKSPVYQYPMSNTYQDLRICWGSVREKLLLPKEIRRVASIFFGSVFSGHIWGFATPFVEYVKFFAPKGATKDMTEVEKWKTMSKMLNSDDESRRTRAFAPVTSIAEMWKTASGDTGEDPEF